MTPERKAQAREMVESGRWRWIEGMMAPGYGRVERVRDGIPWYWSTERHHLGGWVSLPSDALPDLDDRITALSAELVAQDAWDDPRLHVAHFWTGPTTEVWQVNSRENYMREDCAEVGTGPTKLDALIAAILAAPEKKT